MRKKILFIFNPHSGKGSVKNKLFDIIDAFVKYDYEVIVHPTRYPKDGYHRVKTTAKEVDLIVCCGGDGTLDEVVSGLMQAEVHVPIGYIPAGSTNDFANSLEIPKDMVTAAHNIMDGKRYSFDVGTFNDETFVYVAAFGMFTDVSYQTNQELKNMLGHLAYVMEGAKKILDIKKYRMKVEANGNVYEGDYIYGMITNSYSVGGFKNLTGKNVEMDDGLFEVTLIKMPKNPLELNEIITALATGYDHTDMIDAFKTDRLTVHSVGNIPVAWTLDGEFGGNQVDVEIRNKKQALDIIINT